MAREPQAPRKGVTPLRGVRRVMAERMVQSFTTAPHFYLSVEVDGALLVQTRETLLAETEDGAVRPTLSDLLLKITGRALREQPEVNAVWEDGGVCRLDLVNIGLAVATDQGLVVPVLRDVDRKTLAEIAAQRHAVTERARKGRLEYEDVQGGSFTISNLGMFAVDHFNAVLNPPQAAVLAVGRVKERAAVVHGQLTVRPTLFLTLSVDHRILDGAEGARFLSRLADLVEASDPTDFSGR